MLSTTVVATSPGEGQVLASAPAAIVLQFNEPIDPASIGVDDLVLDWGSVTGAAVVASDSVRYTVTGLTRDGLVTYQLLNRAITDTHGTPASGFTGHFTIDDPLIDRYPSTDVPKNIPDRTTITSTLTISGEQGITIADLDVQLNITHTWASDLDVYLVAPDGTRVELFTDVGGGGGNFTNTILDDEAPTSIATATAPFSGRFRPEGLLSTVDGFDARGTWTLEITDDYAQDVGTLHSWELIIERDVDIQPRINAIQPLPPDGGHTWAAIDSLSVRFSEVMDADSVNDAANWQLVEAGADQTFDTADDVPNVLSLSPTYVNGLNATLAISGGMLPEGQYRLTVFSDGLKDLLGNPLDGNADGTGGDDYVRYFDVMPKVSAIPFTETFEAGALAGLGGYWEFVTSATGRVGVSNAQGPHDGLYHLLLDEIAAYAGPQYATLHLELAGRTGLTLDFWQKEFGDRYAAREDRVQMSADGQSWYDLVLLQGTNSSNFYRHFTIDLDAAIAAAGIAYTGDFQIRFSQDNYYLSSGGFAFDDIRVSQLDLLGPRALSHSPTVLASDGGPLGTLQVTFNEPIAVASFTVADVVLKDAQGKLVTPLSVAPVAGSGDTQFNMTFADQDLRGLYRLLIGPEISDLAGNAMNQDQDALNGETNGQDTYNGTVEFQGTVWSPAGAAPQLYADGFEGWTTAVPSAWRFYTVGSGTIGATTAGTPQAGTQHLQFQTVGSYPTQSAVLAVDLTGREAADDLFLTFWAKYASTSSTLYVDFSGAEGNWQEVAVLSPNSGLSTTYTNFTLDLDALATSKGIARDADFFIRFRDYSSSSSANHLLYLDDVRIMKGDLMGPRVTAQSPTVLASDGGPLAALQVTFNEPIAVANFTVADVVLKDAQGNVVEPVAVTPVAGSGDTQFNMTFADQDLRGLYRLSIGPEISDLAGNAMNQDQDALNGEATDVYSGTIRFAPAVWTGAPAPEPAPRYQVLYDEPFESWSTVPSYWAFQTAGDGTVQAASGGSLHGGVGHLLFDLGTSAGGLSYPTQAAILAVDLTGYETATDLNLDFWAKWSSSSYPLYADFSGDGSSWQEVTWLTVPSAYTNYSLDLDALASSKGIARDADFFVRFRAYSHYSHDFYLDDVRIVAGDLTGPRVTSHSPLALPSSGDPLSAIRVTFDEAITVSSFEPDGRDVELKDAAGNTIAPLSVTPVADSEDKQFDVTFAGQNLRGIYRLRVGPQITDTSGNPMNQNGNAINGEATDVYSGTVTFSPTVWTGAPVPEPTPRYQVLYDEPFEDFSPVPTYRAFQTVGDGTVQAASGGSPHGGVRHLLFDLGTSAGGVTYPTQAAILAVDLTGYETAADLNLDFWAKWSSSSNSLYVDFSGDGLNWQQVTSLTVPSTYTNYSLDLDVLASSKGIARDADFFVRFRAYSDYSYDFFLDDVRIVAGDLTGPRVTSHSPLALPSLGDPLSAIRLTFDEPIAVSSFESDGRDVELKDATGNTTAPLSVTPVVGSEDKQFDVTFAGQNLRGIYRLRVGPQITDTSGNPMNQNGNAINGEAADSYSGTVVFAPAVWTGAPAPKPAPRHQVLYDEPFESWSAVPSYWAFQTVGDGTLQAASGGSPHGGVGHLLFDMGTSAGGVSYPTQAAILAVDLTGYETAADLNLDLWAKWSSSSNSLYVDFSGDGSNWQQVTSLTVPSTYTNYSLDLDALASSKGIARDADFFVRFRAYGHNSYDFYLDDVRIVAGDLVGPQVIGQSPTEPIDGPVTHFDVTFDEPVGDFPLDQARLWGPLNNSILPISVSSTDSLTWTIAFPIQQMAGRYEFIVGPGIRDVYGNLMNQDRDVINGETNGHDDYDGVFHVNFHPVPASYSYYQGFEDATTLDDHWSFSSGAGGRIQIVNESGDKVLRIDGTGSFTYTTSEAVFAVDLSGQTGVKLYWNERNPADEADSTDGVYVSSDQGATWFRIDPLSGRSSSWQSRAIDLDEAIQAAEISYTADFRIKFQVYTNYNWPTDGRQFDDIRLTWEGAGAKVIEAAASGAAAAPFTLDGLPFTFDEAIDAATFTLADVVSFTGPGNVDLTDQLTGVSGSGTSFTVHFTEQTAPGGYIMTIGPYIQDLAGNPLDQNGNGVLGETVADRYTIRTILLQPAGYPYAQSFDDWTGLSDPAGQWFFNSTANGRIQWFDDAGDKVLRMDSSPNTWATNEAIFAVDLSGRTGVTLYFNEYNPYDETDNSDGVFISDDRDATWYRADRLSSKSTAGWQTRVVDLDAALAASDMSYTNNFLIRFQQYGYYGWITDGRQFDDIRVTWEGAGPKVIEATASGAAAAPFTLDGLTFTFDEAIDAATFTLADVVSFTGPGNVDLTDQLTGVSGSGTSFTVHFNEQTAPGGYTMTIGPYIRDLAGNPLDQNGNGVLGETVADRYTIRTILLQPAAYPYAQSFDDWTSLSDPTGQWFFNSTANGRIQWFDDAGDKVLRMDSPPNTWTTNEAIFAIDLSGRTGIKLYFNEYNPYDETDNSDGVFISDDRGATWYRADPLSSKTAGWQTRVVDLDAALAASDMSYTNNFLIRFQQYGYYGWISDGRQFDDIRVTWEGAGAKVIEAAVSGAAAPFTLDGLTFTFDEAIDAATFTLADVVSFTGPGNVDLTDQLIGVSGSGTSFTVHFTEQTASGGYTMTIGPYIQDLAGNPLDQNGNGVLGETVADRYTIRTILLQPAAYPYAQSFDDWTSLSDPAGQWFFNSTANGRIQWLDDAGDKVLRMDSALSWTNATGEAVVAVDLAGRTSVKLYFNEYNPDDDSDSGDGIYLSDDRGLTWYRCDTLGPKSGSWQRRIVDLDAAIAAGGLTYTNNFLIRFQTYTGYYWPTEGREFDDIRITWEGDEPKLIAAAPAAGFRESP